LQVDIRAFRRSYSRFFIADEGVTGCSSFCSGSGRSRLPPHLVYLGISQIGYVRQRDLR
jgi:hypothetical protein